MRKDLAVLLCASSMLAIVPAVQARVVGVEAAQPSGEGASDLDAIGDDIVVTARRREESLQDVPSTVNVVSSQTIEKLNLQDFKDIQAVTPGLELKGGNDGFDATVSLRGVTVDPQSSASPVVQFYVNEVPVDPNILFQSMFDIGQVELLRGPQGTLRGRSAPAGAMTVGTRRANPREVGGYLEGSVDTYGQLNVNGALNVPLIQDVLGLRIAGIVDHDDAGGVRSVNSSVAPRKETEGLRASLAFEPVADFTAHLTYQRMSARSRTFGQVAGTGALGTPASGPPAPVQVDLTCFCAVFTPVRSANYNGPALSFRDRRAVADTYFTSNQTIDIATANIDWRFAGQKLSYVGGWQRHRYENRGGGDVTNMFVGELPGTQDTDKREWDHEIRLASEERIAGIFDYTAGIFLQRFRSSVAGKSPVLLGNFNPFATVPVPGGLLVQPRFVDPNKVGQVVISLNPRNKEFSYFGTITAHLGDRTELSAGARHIHTSTAFQGPYGRQGVGSSICFDFPTAAIPIPQLADYCFANGANEKPIKNDAWVWSASLSHRFSEDLLAYVNAGSSFRAGPFSVVTLDLEPAGYQSASDLRFHAPEKSRGVEVGVKSSLFDRRLNISIAAYYQKYKNHIFLTPATWGYDVPGARISQIQFIANADAVVKGVDIDASLRIARGWSLGAAFSWTKGNFDNDDIPCNDGNFDGVPDNIRPDPAGYVSRRIVVARCKSSRAINDAPRWNLTLQSEYSHPVSDGAEAFVRGLFSYQPSNPNRAPDVAVIDAYGLLNLYAGVRAPDGAWTVMVYAKNALNTVKLTDRGVEGDVNPFFGYSGYYGVSTTPRREVGLNLRWAFGSR